ncbi:hypothetical protein K490DRAFT_67419 [Saccharata proteae CBS 121410]|uniref:Uncharacterized protein n=1 Tax=Saccharata proteae CBS 121410 TaxID=1314787 RepID=A0A9P4HUG0_9PEZI|nr:hypothetical protein K490DRAFT_67419 [Saccharata proteae CBS 121410]
MSSDMMTFLSQFYNTDVPALKAQIIDMAALAFPDDHDVEIVTLCFGDAFSASLVTWQYDYYNVLLETDRTASSTGAALKSLIQLVIQRAVENLLPAYIAVETTIAAALSVADHHHHHQHHYHSNDDINPVSMGFEDDAAGKMGFGVDHPTTNNNIINPVSMGFGDDAAEDVGFGVDHPTANNIINPVSMGFGDDAAEDMGFGVDHPTNNNIINPVSMGFGDDAAEDMGFGVDHPTNNNIINPVSMGFGDDAAEDMGFGVTGEYSARDMEIFSAAIAKARLEGPKDLPRSEDIIWGSWHAAETSSDLEASDSENNWEVLETSDQEDQREAVPATPPRWIPQYDPEWTSPFQYIPAGDVSPLQVDNMDDPFWDGADAPPSPLSSAQAAPVLPLAPMEMWSEDEEEDNDRHDPRGWGMEGFDDEDFEEVAAPDVKPWQWRQNLPARSRPIVEHFVPGMEVYAEDQHYYWCECEKCGSEKKAMQADFVGKIASLAEA